jgi:hypothetical protein
MTSTVSLLQHWWSSNDTRPSGSQHPHFYEETLAYISGDLDVIDLLPAVKASALRKAKRSRTRAVLPSKEKKLDKVVGRPTITVMTSTFTVMTRPEISPAAAQAAASRARVEGTTSRSPLRNATITTKSQGTYPVYDGLRSSPHTNLTTNPHVWKIFKSPFLDASLPADNSNQYTNQAGSTANSPSTSHHTTPNFSLPLKPHPRPQPPTRVLRTPPKLATNRHHYQQSTDRPSTPHPRPAATFQPLPRRAPPRPQNHSNQLRSPPPQRRRQQQPQQQQPPQRPWPHYTSHAATTLLTSLKAHLHLPTTGPASLPPAQLLARLLLKWRAAIHLPQQNPRLAGWINQIDWTGVGETLPEESFSRGVVERWVGRRQVLFAW